ncbi:peptide/nickel transport system permease protein [Arthrobacter sp. V4I6]|uniref:ABC transporter permease n=1 Tax=unclassified Arthrobacter TaxID=235627 RepID=UPI00278B8D33|nr:MULTISPECIES: ABC transporter permease [unclassified Arthrobacter]MDQ0822400.1 peptide/nickel transport system permease protein [Arthrobacter sp. V1I7]MDQ0852026.1 peptide/nickel transport system permease protein [Arthrobacter sp. V4I6]
MSATTTAAPAFTAPGNLSRVVRSILKSRSATFGFALVILNILLALFAPLLTSYDPIATDAMGALQESSGAHLLGTDALGRDTLTRTLFGGQYALAISFSATALTVLLGSVIAGIAAYRGGIVDDVITRVLDSVLAVPAILSMLVVVTIFGTGPWVIILAVVVVYTGGVTRIVRAAVMDVLPKDYITAAKARGEGMFSVLAREVFPNVLDIILVEFAMRASWVVLLISSLSFLGFGASPPTPDWGLMVAENRNLMSVVPLATLSPIVALATLIVGLNLAADGLAKSLGVDRMKEVLG